MSSRELRLIPLALLFAIACSKSNSPAPPPVNPGGPSKPDTIQGTSAAIDPSNGAQIIRGFGGATVFLGALTTAEMNLLYGTQSGQLGLTVLRIRVDPGGPGNWGVELGNAQKAIANGAIVMATPWSPPANFKSNGSTIGGVLDTASYAAYANYLDSFAVYMSANGAPLYALSIQNEPDISVTYESCNWTAQQLFNFMKYNAPAIKNTRLIASESFHFDPSYTDPILNDSTAASHLSIVGGHIYGAGLAPYPLAVSKGKEVWMTEHLDTSTDWTGALNTAKEISDCMGTAGFSVYNWWYLKRSYGPIDQNDNPTKRGYVMAQFAKFVRPGSQRISVTYSPSNNVYVTAYKHGTGLVIVVVNMGTTVVNQPFSVTGTSPSSFTPYVTSADKSLSSDNPVNVGSGSFSYPLLPKSVTTFVSN
ncbi:MAG TPA: glycoside hydrolase family 30 beta sandwich domain-containing protein [Puia sp.]|jgi:glucuronoarabinoxylan endo-1,4-beta-xylanase|nr:glycoside hydrolase family 30 beta sandwich domain-containing protein [Puia sp.]